MQTDTLIQKMRERIRSSLTPLITHDYVLLDLPYYDNIGDTLIWEGTLEFLKTLPYKCLYYASKDSFRYRKLSSDVVILLQGGGNFGDLYRLHSEFRKKIIALYPNNKIIILPQSVFYQTKQYVDADAQIYASHKSLYICARELYSFVFLKEHFQNKCLLVPDMAFYINVAKYRVSDNENRILYLRRKDKELASDTDHLRVPQNAEVHDWPTYEQSFSQAELVEKACYKIAKLVDLFGVRDKYKVKIDDWKRCYFYRKFYVQVGIDFLSPYSIIYTTRLHVMILGLLLGKKLFLINNTSGKVINYYTTWLEDLDNINVLSNG